GGRVKGRGARRGEGVGGVRELRQGEKDAGKRARLALALLPVEPSVRDEVVNWMLRADDPAEVVLARDALAAYGSELAPSLWDKTGQKTAAPQRFRALVALAAFDPKAERWKQVAPSLVEELLGGNALHLGAWVQALEPVRAALQGQLCSTFRDRAAERKGQREAAAEVLARYLVDAPETLFELIEDSDADQ